MKLYCVSDIHGFYNEFIKSLNETDFEIGNPEHKLVVCGDCFDRGPDNYKVMEYLKNVPNKVLIKGNHCSLLLDCIERREPWSHDYHNGTYNTIMELGKYYYPYAPIWDEACDAIEKPVKEFIDQMVDYWETKSYIFVHSFIPLNYTDNLPKYYLRNRTYAKMENWRDADVSEWEHARWGNPFELSKPGLLPDKTLVFGHFHTSYAHSRKDGTSEFGPDANFSPFFGDGFIGIDACTAHSRKVNVIVLEDELLKE